MIAAEAAEAAAAAAAEAEEERALLNYIREYVFANVELTRLETEM